MIAGPVYNEKLSAPEGRLQKLIRARKADEEIIREFYLAAYARPPQAEELSETRRLIA